MSKPMKSDALVFFATPGASAHRVDESVVQTLIELEPTGVVLHVDLTPGVAVAASVIADIDADGDGVLSGPEQSAPSDFRHGSPLSGHKEEGHYTPLISSPRKPA